MNNLAKIVTPRMWAFALTWVLLCFTVFMAYYEQYNVISLYVFYPLMTVIAFIQKPKIFPNNYFKWLIILYIWVSFTTVGAYDTNVALRELHQILGCILATYIFAQWAQYRKAIPWLYAVFIVLFIGAVHYARTSILEGNYDLIGKERVSDDLLNANTIAYFTFYLTFVIFILGDIIHTPLLRTLFRAGYFLTFPIIYWVAMATASVQVGAIIAPFSVVLLFFRYWGTKEEHKLWLRFLLVLSLIAVVYKLAPILMTEIMDSRLGARLDTGGTSANRLQLVRESFSVGLHHPLIGVGPGNFRLFSFEQVFSHNTYLELFANTGFIGMLIFIGLTFSFCWTQWKRWREKRQLIYFIFLVFGIFFIGYQFFYVFYTDLRLMAFWMLVVTHSETYYSHDHT